jgi:hypothetical protein
LLLSITLQKIFLQGLVGDKKKTSQFTHRF